LLAAVAILTITLAATIILADTPVKQVALQGRLSDPTGKPLDGSFSVKFEIFASATEGATGTGLWSEAQKVTVTKGLFGVNLGSATQGGIPLAFDKPYWVEVSIGAEKLSPRYPLTSAPYSFYGGVAGNIDASKIIGILNVNQVPALTADKILSVNPSAIVGTIPDSKISSVSVNKLYYTTADKSGQAVIYPGIPAALIKGTLNSEQIPALDAGKISGTLAAAQIPSLDAGKITTGTLLAARIPVLDAGKITTGTFAADRIPGIDAAKIISNTFATDRIPGLDAAKIISGTFGTARLTDGAVTSAKIANDAITGNKILNKTIENGDIADGAINGRQIQDGGIRHADIAPFEIESGLIDNNAVTTDKIDAKAVTTAKISDGAVTSAKLAKHYLAGEANYAGKGLKIVSSINNQGIRDPAICTCSVPDYAYTCNCWVMYVTSDETNVYAYAFNKDGTDMPKNNLIDWIIVER